MYVEAMGIDINTMEIVDMAPAESQVAFSQRNLDMVCGWGGALRRMLKEGNVLLTGDEETELGILVLDVTSGPADFVAEEADLVSQFLAVTAKANAMWNAGGAEAEAMIPVIAQDAGMDVDATAATLATFTFPSVEERLSGAWLGGTALEFMKGVADVFVEAGSIPSALDTYENAVDTGPLGSADAM